MGLLARVFGRRRPGLPFDMFDVDAASLVAREARRAKRIESIYHVGQARIWDGRAVLAELVAKHGPPRVGEKERRALARIFSIIMWGELAAWKISAQLADALVPLEAKLAASSQVHDEARHFYVMHDYLTALGETPAPLDFWSKRVVEMTLGTDDLVKKLLGMQLTIETIALTIFQHVRELEVDPLLSELLVYYERDEARHVGLGTQLVPQLFAKMSLAERLSVAGFQVELLGCAVLSLKAMAPDLATIGVDARELLAIAFKKQQEVQGMMREDFSWWPEDPPVNRLFHGMCEALFPSEGEGARVPPHVRIARGIAVVARTREGVHEVALRAREARRAAQGKADDVAPPMVAEAE